MNCANCGEALRAGAAFCERCGRPAHALPASSTAQNLVLAGGILGTLLLVGGGLLFLFVGALLSSVFEPLFGSGSPRDLAFFPLAMLASTGVVIVVVGLVSLAMGAGWGWAAWSARRDLREGRKERGSLTAIIAGSILLFFGLSTVLLAVPGALVLAGGILARTS